MEDSKLIEQFSRIRDRRTRSGEPSRSNYEETGRENGKGATESGRGSTGRNERNDFDGSEASTQTPRQPRGETGPTIISIGEFGNEAGRRSKGFNEGESGGVKSGATKGRRKDRKTQKAEAISLDLSLVDEDRQDIVCIVQGVGNNLKNLTQFPGFEISSEEADTIALPAARIMARHGWSEHVRKVSDPFLLLSALGTIVWPRVIAYKLWLQMMQMQIQQQMQQQQQGQEQFSSDGRRFTGVDIGP